MGDKLTDNNPNIADLSDKNRPTKLAERYAELYDNHWTDAFDVLQAFNQGEETVIEILINILKVTSFLFFSLNRLRIRFKFILAIDKSNGK
jgi:hypothetical protein